MNRIHFLALLSALLTFFCFMACEEEDPDGIKFIYNETKCSDPWGIFLSDDEIREGVEEYLSSNNVEALKVKIICENPPQTCDACKCFTGRIIEVIIDESDVKKMEDLVFRRLED